MGLQQLFCTENNLVFCTELHIHYFISNICPPFESLILPEELCVDICYASLEPAFSKSFEHSYNILLATD